mgnify:CR=1 FL=1
MAVKQISIFVENKDYKNIYVTVLSFGFKYGIPSDADLVFDVRFLPNPYYIEHLSAGKSLAGDEECKNNHLNQRIRYLVIDKEVVQTLDILRWQDHARHCNNITSERSDYHTEQSKQRERKYGCDNLGQNKI